MVSSTLDLDHEWLLATLERLRAEHGDEAEYAQWRSELPADWPL